MENSTRRTTDIADGGRTREARKPNIFYRRERRKTPTESSENIKAHETEKSRENKRKPKENDKVDTKRRWTKAVYKAVQ